MSLINQVLKDLESRHASEMAEATHNLDGLALASPITHRPTKKKYWLLPLFGLILAGTAGSMWWWQQAKTNPQSQTSITNNDGAVQETKPVPTTPIAADKPKPAVESNTHTAKIATPVVATTAQSHNAKAEGIKKENRRVQAEESTTAEHSFEKQMVPLRSEEKAELAYQTGYDEIAQHNDRRAEQQFRQALALEPGHTRAREMLAGVLIKQGRWVETAELLQQGVQATPTHVVFIKLYARALMQLNRDQQAITLLREHAPPIAQDLEHHALLAALYQRQQNHLAAANIYSEILKQQPDAGIWWVGLGISLEAMGKQKQAQQAYTRARQTGALHGDIARYTDNRLLALDSIRYPVD